MRLKTEFQDEDFKLGEVADVNIATMPDGRIKAQAVAKSGGIHTFFYDDLKTFADDWEDVPEEPKEYWYIEGDGDIHHIGTELCDELEIHTMKQIGNYFDSREEAEKAVERLRAWKRLRDKGFRITLQGCKGNAWLQANWGNLQGDYSDVLLLFGGEE